MAYDNTDGGVITMDIILEEGDDEISRTFRILYQFCAQNGRDRRRLKQNPYGFLEH